MPDQIMPKQSLESLLTNAEEKIADLSHHIEFVTAQLIQSREDFATWKDGCKNTCPHVPSQVWHNSSTLQPEYEHTANTEHVWTQNEGVVGLCHYGHVDLDTWWSPITLPVFHEGV